jgi:Lrp/AsnC family transcriptional regulator
MEIGEIYMLDKLDKFDRSILQLIQTEANLNTSEIANKVGLTQPPCWRRIKRLEELGLIQSRVALLNQEKLGLNVTVFARVKLAAHNRHMLPEFEEEINTFPEVLECYTMMGEYDFLLKIVTRDIQSYENFFRKHLSQMTAFHDVNSNVALSKVKYTTALPLNLVD